MANNTVTIEDARLIFRNFTGVEGQWNPTGARSFGVILSEAVAEIMLNDGWNVKYLKASDEDLEAGRESGPPWLPVAVAYDKGRPPRITQITSRGKTQITEDTVDLLDGVEIAVDEETQLPKVDLIVNPSRWEVSGRSGLKAYLQTMYITIVENELDAKYADLDSQ